MPYLSTSSYKAPFWLPGGHIQTIFPNLFRKEEPVSMQRTRIPTPDGDEICLDTALSASNPARIAVILSHGLEGDSSRHYIAGMCRVFTAMGWDCAARNFRSCGGEMNKTEIMYHSGDTDDLHTVVEHCLGLGYNHLLLVGFSMGGNQVLKYLGEQPFRVPAAVRAAVTFSVPCDLPGAAVQLGKLRNRVYMRYFMKTLREKVRIKHAQFPYLYPLKGLDRITTFAEFDERYTAPIHGFSSAEDYWRRASSLPYLHRIRIPTLLVNARNDPFLSPRCSPVSIAENSPVFFLETPSDGGHVGFTSALGDGSYWSELRAVNFFRSTCLHKMREYREQAGPREKSA